jgi:hypothetical protein
MWDVHLAGMLPGEASPVQPCPTNAVLMFGSFDPEDHTSAESIRALDEAMLGIKEDHTAAPMPRHLHRHTDVPADASSSAFMFGANPEQPCPATPRELFLSLRATDTD